MHYSILEQYDVDREKAKVYGFVEDEGKLRLKKAILNTEFYAVVTIDSKNLTINVFDSETNEEYMLFNVVDNISGYVMGVRDKVDLLLEEIKKRCFVKSNVKLQLMDYCSQIFGTISETPWENMPDAFTFKTAKKNKWYALFMTISYKSLGLSKTEKVDIMNIKLPPEKITQLIDRVHYFPAYHMNKKYWLTVILTKDLNINLVKKLIAESYELIEKRDRKQFENADMERL